MKIGKWIYRRGNSTIEKHHWYECPRCGRDVDVKENVCPRCGMIFKEEEWKKYNKEAGE